MGLFINPSSLAPVLLFGLLFVQAAFYFLGVPWVRAATLTFYSASGLLVFGCAWSAKGSIRPFNKIDACFFAFLLIVIVSLGVSSFLNGLDNRLWGYLLFLVVVPYICGRCFGRSSELPKMQALVLISGLTVVPMLLADRLAMPLDGYGRFIFFGMDHSPLMVGALLAATLIALHSWVLCSSMSGREQDRIAKIAGYVLLCLITVFLVWVSARGWLLAGMGGVVVATVITRRVRFLKRISLLAAILLTAVLSLKCLHSVDPRFGSLYAMAGDSLARQDLLLGKINPLALDEATPVLGEASCLPFKQGVDSVAMRRILYQEAIAMFLQKHWLGVGAAAFGWYSCTGPGGFPHSTVLQVFSELGVLGGCIFTALIALAVGTLIGRVRDAKRDSESRSVTFLVSMFVSVFIADQIYGNYFMAVAIWLLIGIVASMRGKPGLGDRADV